VPVETLASVAIRITPKAQSGAQVNRLASAFRNLPQPVMGRVHDGALWFDLRCLIDEADFVVNLDAIENPLS